MKDKLKRGKYVCIIQRDAMEKNDVLPSQCQGIATYVDMSSRTHGQVEMAIVSAERPVVARTNNIEMLVINDSGSIGKKTEIKLPFITIGLSFGGAKV